MYENDLNVGQKAASKSEFQRLLDSFDDKLNNTEKTTLALSIRVASLGDFQRKGEELNKKEEKENNSIVTEFEKRLLRLNSLNNILDDIADNLIRIVG